MPAHRVLAAAMAVCFAVLARAQCTPEFVQGYDYGRLLATSVSAIDSVFCSTVFDDNSGTGPCLFIGGHLRVLGDDGGSWLAKLVGDHWVAVSGFNGPVRCLTVLDDGSGPALYVGGSFTTIPGGAPGVLAKWDGVTWTNLGLSPPSNPPSNFGVHCVARYDDGSGMALYAGGAGLSAAGDYLIMRNSGHGWTPVGAQWSGNGFWEQLAVRGLIAFDNGSGPRLFASGSFTNAGGAVATGVAVWNGSYWTGSGFPGSQADTKSFAIHSVNGTPALYVAGDVSGQSAGAWRLDGSLWTPVLTPGGALGGFVGAAALLSYDDGAGPALYATAGSDGHSCSRVLRLTNAGWSGIGDQFTDATVTRTHLATLALLPGPGGPRLFVAGRCTACGSPPLSVVPTPNAAVWDGTAWRPVEPVGLGLPVQTNVVYDPESDDGFIYAGSRRYDAAGWSPAPYPYSGARTILHLHQGGTDTQVVFGQSLAMNSGSGWQTVPGFSTWFCIGVATDTGQDTLVAVPRSSLPYSVYRFNGSTWTSLGTPLSGSSLYQLADKLISYDSGTGPKIYLGGVLAASSSGPTSFLAYRDSSAWVHVLGVPGRVVDMCVFDVGDGPELILGCTRSGTVGGVAVGGVYRWNGSRIAPLGSGMGPYFDITQLRVFDDGTGVHLWASCQTSTLGPLVFWNGAWQAPPVAINGAIGSFAPARRADRSHSIMFSCGPTTVGGTVACGIAEISMCPRECTADFNGDGDFATDGDIEAFFSCLSGSCCSNCAGADFNNDGQAGDDADIESFFRVLAGRPC